MSDESVWGAPSPGATPPVPPAPAMPGVPGPVPPGWQPPQGSGETQRRTIRRGALTLIFLVGFLGVGACTAFVIGSVQLARGPIKATDQYFSAIKRGDIPAAFAKECPTLQRTDTTESLRGIYLDDPVVSWHTNGVEESSTYGGATVATVTGTLTTGTGTRSLSVDLQKYGGQWRVCDGVPTPR